MRPRVRHEIESQGGLSPPKEFSIGVWIAIAIIVALLIWII